jgi:hypothetical protein
MITLRQLLEDLVVKGVALQLTDTDGWPRNNPEAPTTPGDIAAAVNALLTTSEDYDPQRLRSIALQKLTPPNAPGGVAPTAAKTAFDHLKQIEDRDQLRLLIADNRIGGPGECYVVLDDAICALDADPIVTLTPFTATTPALAAATFETLANAYIPDDPYFDDEAHADRQFDVVATRTVEELERLAADIALTSDDPTAPIAIVVVTSAVEDAKPPKPASVLYYDSDTVETRPVASARDAALFAHALAVFQPTGNEWVTKKGSPGRMSGFENTAEWDIIEVCPSPPSALLRFFVHIADIDRRRAQARQRIKAFLRETNAPELLTALV